MLATHYCVTMQENIRKKQEEITYFINTEKIKQNPNQHKTNKAQQHLEDIQNYKISSSIIRSKEKIILEQEKPNKFFFDKKKQKQRQKTMKQLQTTQNNKTAIITNYFEILKSCKTFYSTLYTKTNTPKNTKNSSRETKTQNKL